MMFQARPQEKQGRTFHAYTPQPQEPRWRCEKCGKKAAGERRQKGEPRTRYRVAFDSKAELDAHTSKRHS